MSDSPPSLAFDDAERLASRLRAELGRAIFGQTDVVHQILICGAGHPESNRAGGHIRAAPRPGEPSGRRRRRSRAGGAAVGEVGRRAPRRTGARARREGARAPRRPQRGGAGGRPGGRAARAASSRPAESSGRGRRRGRRSDRRAHARARGLGGTAARQPRRQWTRENWRPPRLRRRPWSTRAPHS